MLMIPNIPDDDSWGPTPEAVAAMMQYNELLSEEGALISLDGLYPPSSGARVTFSGGRATVSDGPSLDTPEAIGGYWMIDVPSKEKAVEWALRCPAADGDVIEVRRLFEMEEYAADLTGG